MEIAEGYTVGIATRTWRGMGGMGLALHHYGKIWCRDEYWNHMDGEDIQRVLDADGAAELNKKDNEFSFLGSFNLKRGDKTNRFNTEDDVIRAGIRLLRSYGYEGPIELGGDYDEDNTVLSVEAQNEKLAEGDSKVGSMPCP